MRIRYTIEWTRFGGLKQTLSTEFMYMEPSYIVEEGLRNLLEEAKLAGWTLPKWWQWWRRNDTRVPEEIANLNDK